MADSAARGSLAFPRRKKPCRQLIVLCRVLGLVLSSECYSAPPKHVPGIVVEAVE